MIGSLFSGYGGLDMAAEALGFGPTAWHCEIEPAPAKVLAHRWPGVPNLGDITKVDWTQVEPVDVITGGFPCQDISNAGKRAGMAGARSGLWSHYADAVRVLRPRLVLVENVGALLTRGMGRVLGDLAALGYDARWVSVRAADAGAPHGRQRIFIIAADAASEPWRVGDGDDVRARSGADGRRSPAGRSAAQNADVEPRQQHRVAAPRSAESGGARADAGGRGGAPTPDAERGARGERREPDPIGGRTRDAEQAGVGGVDAAPDADVTGLERSRPVGHGSALPEPVSDGRPAAADAEGDGRDEGRPESARLERRPDAPVSGATRPAPPDTASGGLGTRVDDDVPGRGEPDAARSGAAGQAAPDAVGRGRDGRARDAERGTVRRATPARSGEVTDAAPDAGGARLGEHPGESPTQEARPDAGHVAAGHRRPRTDRDGRQAPADADSGRRESVAELDSAASARVDGEHRGHADGRGDGIAWGPYEGAIRRWEHAVGRYAPRPTEPGPRGGERLSPAFVEWMMGLPAGWVTDVPGLSRNEQLKMLGNGVVPQQAVLAFTALLRAWAVAA